MAGLVVAKIIIFFITTKKKGRKNRKYLNIMLILIQEGHLSKADEPFNDSPASLYDSAVAEGQHTADAGANK